MQNARDDWRLLATRVLKFLKETPSRNCRALNFSADQGHGDIRYTTGGARTLPHRRRRVSWHSESATLFPGHHDKDQSIDWSTLGKDRPTPSHEGCDAELGDVPLRPHPDFPKRRGERDRAKVAGGIDLKARKKE